MILKAYVLDGNEDNIEVYTYSRDSGRYLVYSDTRNPNSENVLEENKAFWEVVPVWDEENSHFTKGIPIQGLKHSNEWINEY